MARWQPMASMVTIQPSITRRSSSAGIAVISFDLVATLTWPSTRRCCAANAETIWIAALPLFLLWERRTVQGPHPGCETMLEFLGVEDRKDIAELVVRGRPVAKRPEPAQQSELFLAEPRDLDEAIRTSQHRKQTQQQYLGERINYLAVLSRVRQTLEIK